MANNNFNTWDYVVLKDGDYFELVLADAILRSKYTKPVGGEILTSGTYKVGVDIPAGEYKLTSAGHSGYWERSKDRRGFHSIIANGISEQSYVTVQDGEYLVLTGVIARQ